MTTEAKMKTINGVQFPISQPYEVGGVIGEAEARALNQVRAENIGNNTRAKIKEAQDAGKSDKEIQDIVAEVDASYELTVASVSAGRKLDPVEREARKIARELLKTHLAESGRKLTVAPEGESDESWAEKIEANLEQLMGNEEVLKVAKKNVDDKKKQADKLAEAISGVKV